MADTIIKHVSAENLKQYDGLIKAHLAAADQKIKDDLQAEIDILAGALDAEEARALAAETANKKLAEDAQTAADNAQAHSEDLAAKVGTVAEGKTVMGIITEIQESAYDDSELRELISNLDENKADKSDVAAEVEAIEEAIALKADKTALDEVSGVANAAATKEELKAEENRAKGEETRIAGLVTAEAETARAAEKANADAIKAVSDDYLKKADKEALQGQIDTLEGAVELLTNGADADKVDGVNDLIKYVDEHGAEVTGMKNDISTNADSIEALEEKVGDKTVQAQISEAIAGQNLGQYATDAELTAAKDRITELEEIDHDAYKAADTALQNTLTTEINKKADQTTLDSLDEAYKAADTALETAVKGYTNTEVAKDRARLDSLEAASATHALASDLNTANGKITTAEGKISTLEGEMDAVEAKASANETAIGNNTTAIATKASQDDLNAAVARIEANEEFIENIEFMTEADINGLF